MVSTEAYGTWPSPIDAALTAAQDGKPEFVGTVGDEVWWTEPRPAEGGRRALVRRRADGATGSVLPAPWNPRSRVIEYGGMPWAGAPRQEGGPLVVFVHFPDQRLYAYAPDGPDEPWPLTPVSDIGGGLRWVDPQLQLAHGEVWCVLEEFTGESPTDVRRVIAAVPLDGSAAADRGAVRELTDDRNRFVTGPRLSHDGSRVAWIAWDHPQMPWDGTVVKMADVTADGTFTGVRPLVGDVDESVVQVEWDRDGSLLFVSDVGGWWELQRIRPDAVADAVVPTSRLCAVRNEEFGGPLWRIGLRWFQLLDNGLVAVIHGRGTTALGVLDPETGELVDAVGPWTAWAETLAVQDTRVIGIAASPHTSYEVVELDTATGHTRTIGAPHEDAVDPAYHPEPVIRTFTGPGGREIHAHVYPPRHPDRTGPEGELPPYVIWAHGGPTGRTPLVLDLEIAYFTSRGIGVAEVDYGGSTGYGRAYRERLREEWGVVDVEDCAAVALGLAEEGSADRARLAIRGGSAGGWTTAASLTRTDVYACGAISYPILDLEGWATGETHDFESQYLESLVGPYAEVPERYRERSPVNHTDRITAPFLLLQGLDDPICPPVQCERFLTAIEGRGIPHAYISFEGEGHGFRRADTVRRALEAELSLYVQTFGIERPDVPRLELRK
ncbi:MULTISPECIES: prolyl oligopeptidase family serine peptidase [Streptomyces]|uniref:Prolyl oligopeptidase family serine peptidase n=1 Tax=Streptomyces glycanivorans TaxID=3033808 RepID=A0ABY9J5P0_9ACTN|nr:MULTISPECIES: prolyl oligopeptidase family serine peptidase [unclassified Streptomyces]WLQ62940.1 prolyl oligopeptidase family serine peptidase [Streptomyces sp. Alt3]WSQ83701.1 prolyl oligopeptidase family serine peptidase [Streptomyces sp. NBC_01212]WSR10271.1 prolyl oligopeptidase family serine peptidase [Streptomyces sp. NBC_01208]WSR47030.1 prolyl oligopeptidase family serine peptidase [Streptomyces sp. NBC_01201]